MKDMGVSLFAPWIHLPAVPRIQWGRVTWVSVCLGCGEDNRRGGGRERKKKWGIIG